MKHQDLFKDFEGSKSLNLGTLMGGYRYAESDTWQGNLAVDCHHSTFGETQAEITLLGGSGGYNDNDLFNKTKGGGGGAVVRASTAIKGGS